MRVISEHYSGGHPNRKALVEDHNGSYVVVYIEEDEVIATESYAEKSLQYHEDAAENFVLGIKKLTA